MSMFVSQEGNRVELPSGTDLVTANNKDADILFDEFNKYGNYCYFVGSAVTLISAVAGVAIKCVWDEKIAPKLREKKNKRLGL